MKIYFLDDTPIFLHQYKVIFQDCKTFSNFNDAMLAVHEDPPDIFVCDLVMPDVDGWMVVDAINELYPNIKIIIATSMSGPEQKQYAELKGYRFWCKSGPISLKRFISETK